jgi:hypothetical protein
MQPCENNNEHMLEGHELDPDMGWVYFFLILSLLSQARPKP